MKVELAPLEPLAPNRENVLDPLGKAHDHFAHAFNLVFRQVIEALFREHLPPELLHVIVVSRLELSLGEVANRPPEGLHEPLDEVAHGLDLFLRHPALFKLG